MEYKYIYLLHAIEAKTLTKKEIIKKFKEFKITYGKEDMSFEQYKKFKESCDGNISFEIRRSTVGYFTDKNIVKEAAMSNVGDYNDCGVYNYSMIERLETNKAYPETSYESEYLLFQYNERKNCYKPISFDENEITKEIQKKYDCFWKWRKSDSKN